MQCSEYINWLLVGRLFGIVQRVFVSHPRVREPNNSFIMKLSTLFITPLSFIPSLVAAASTPDVAPHNETLAKRGGEVNYLSNCQRVDAAIGPFRAIPLSYIAWYSNIDNTQSGNDVCRWLQFFISHLLIFTDYLSCAVQKHPNSLSSEYRNWAAGGKFNLRASCEHLPQANFLSLDP